MYRFLSVVVTAASLLVTLPADAQNLNKKLKGDYAATVTSFCAQASTPFTPESQATNTVSPLHRVVETKRSYDGEGNVSITGRTFQLASTATAPGSFPVSESEFTCSGTYEVNDDLTFSETFSCAGNIVVGAGAGLTFTQEPRTTSGRIHKKKILFSDTRGQPQTVIQVQGVATPSFRLCAGSGIGVKIKEDSED
jgi:hypothetical protein